MTNATTDFIKDNIGTIGTGVGGVLVGGAVGYIAGRSTSTKKRKRNKSRSVRKGTNKHRKGRKLKFGSKAYRKRYCTGRRRKAHRKGQKHPYTAGCRKDTSHTRIRYTKNNQPYIIQPNGRARFISKSSVHNRRKRQGGSY